MDISKLLPKASYDVVSRFVPGAALLLLFPPSRGTTFETYLKTSLGPSVDLVNSTVVVVVVAVLIAYVAGTLVASASVALEPYGLIVRSADSAKSKKQKTAAEKLGSSVEETAEVFDGISTASEAKRRIIRWYANALDAADSSDAASSIRDVRARPRMLFGLTVVFFACSVSALVAKDFVFTFALLVAGIASYVAARREHQIFVRDTLRRHRNSGLDTCANQLPAQSDELLEGFEAGEELGSPDLVITGGDSDSELLQSYGAPKGRFVSETPFGSVAWSRYGIDRLSVVLVHRYFPGGHRQWNPQANIWFLAENSVDRVLSINGVGAISPELERGDLVVPVDFLDATGRQGQSFSNLLGIEHYVRMNPPFCPMLTDQLIEVLEGQERGGIAVKLACTHGPRVETPMEVEALKRLGAEIVGMRQSTEAILAREAGICFSSVSIVLNAAESEVRADKGGSLQTITKDLPRERLNTSLEALVRMLLRERSPDRKCGCQDSLSELKRRGYISSSLVELAERIP